MDIFQILALKGTRKIIADLAKKGPTKYSDLVKGVGFSTTTTRALKGMESLRLVERRVLDEPYRPVSYVLTERGKDVAKLISELERLFN